MICGMYASVATMSVIPWERTSSTMCSMQGRPATVTIGFGWFEVRGRSLVPSPPAMTTAFKRAGALGPGPAQARYE
jgi:hypothetical protein